MITFDARSAGFERTSGWERYTRALAERLEASNDVRLWASACEPLARRLASDVMAAGLPKHVRVHFPTFPPLNPDRYARLVLTVHDLTWWKFPETASALGRRYYRPLLERAIPRADAIITHSETVRDEVVHHFNVSAERVHATLCGADSFAISAQVENPRDRPYVLAVGSLEPRKNLERLVLAYEQSGARNNFDLLIVGRAAWGSKPRGVEVMHGVDDELLGRLYRFAEAVVVPSVYEGFGLPLVEALSVGTPVICSDIPVFREVAGSNATYFDPYSVADIAERLKNLDSTRVPGHAVMEVRSVYTWDNVAERVRRVYAHL